MKLQKKDIVLLNEGQQIRNKIIELYGSIEKFITITNIPISLATILDYTKRKKVTSSKFKACLVISLNMSYDQIVLSEEKQIENYVDKLYEDFYSQEFEVMEYLKAICLTKEMLRATAKIYRMLAMHNYSNNKKDIAVMQLKLAVEIIENRNEASLLISFLLDLAVLYYYTMQYDHANQIFDLLQNRLLISHSADNNTLFKFYIRYGNLHLAITNYSMARKLFQKALEYTSKGYEISKLYINIGLTFRRHGNYSKALEHYQIAIKHTENTDISGLCIIYNNISEVYKSTNDFGYALKYINKSINALKNNFHDPLFKACYITYFQIKLQMNLVDETAGDLIKLLYKLDEENAPKSQIFQFINYFINLNIENIIDKLEIFLRYYLGSCTEKENIKMIMNSLSKIYLYRKFKSADNNSASFTSKPPSINITLINEKDKSSLGTVIKSCSKNI